MNYLKASPILLLIGIVILAAPHLGGLVPLPTPGSDVLSQAYEADRISQIAVLRELALQPFDGATDEGRRKAGEWFNSSRFRDRGSSFAGYTDEVAEAIADNAEDVLADRLEGKK